MAFTKVSVKNMLLWHMEGILGILHLFRKLCLIDHYFLGVIAGSLKDFPKREKQLDEASLIVLFHLE